MMRTTGNDAAYPYTSQPDDILESHGLTKRELLAAMMMQGLCTNGQDHDIKGKATLAVVLADFLISELNRPRLP